MNRNLALLIFLLLVLFMKIPGLLRLRSVRDAVTFCGIWLLTVGAVLAEWARLPQFRPIDWVRSVMELLS